MPHHNLKHPYMRYVSVLNCIFLVFLIGYGSWSCSLFTKKDVPDPSSASRFMELQYAKVGILDSQPTWKCKILWKTKEKGNLKIIDTERNSPILDRNITEHNSILWGNPIDLNQSSHSWLTDDSKSETISLKIQFTDEYGTKFTSLSTTQVSRETKHSLKKKFRNL